VEAYREEGRREGGGGAVGKMDNAAVVLSCVSCVQIMDATRARTKAQLSAGSHVSAKFASMELAAARGTHR
jgi:hypothetical protein